MRRGNGEGSIFYHERKRRWVGTITTGYDAHGQRRRRSVSARTKGALLERLQQLQTQHATGTLPAPSTVTLAAFLQTWLAAADLRPGTRAFYAGVIRTHVLPRLGGVAVSRLTPSLLQTTLADLQRAGVGAATCTRVFAILRTALRQAVRQRLLAVHPGDGVLAPVYHARPVSTFSADELRRLFAAAQTDRLQALYVLLGTSGLRLGEALGLSWSTVDLTQGTVSIARQLREVHGTLDVGDPKTARARRTLPLTALAVEALRAHRTRQLAAGQYQAAGLVFTDARGGPLRRSNVRRRSWLPLLQRARVPGRPLHALRHTAATLLLESGAPVHVVAGLLGHARASITLDVYAAYIPAAGAEAVGKLDALLGQPMDSQSATHGRTVLDSGGHRGAGAAAVVVPFPDVGAPSRTVAD